MRGLSLMKVSSSSSCASSTHAANLLFPSSPPYRSRKALCWRRLLLSWEHRGGRKTLSQLEPMLGKVRRWMRLLRFVAFPVETHADQMTPISRKPPDLGRRSLPPPLRHSALAP